MARRRSSFFCSLVLLTPFDSLALGSHFSSMPKRLSKSKVSTSWKNWSNPWRYGCNANLWLHKGKGEVLFKKAGLYICLHTPAFHFLEHLEVAVTNQLGRRIPSWWNESTINRKLYFYPFLVPSLFKSPNRIVFLGSPISWYLHLSLQIVNKLWIKHRFWEGYVSGTSMQDVHIILTQL